MGESFSKLELFEALEIVLANSDQATKNYTVFCFDMCEKMDKVEGIEKEAAMIELETNRAAFMTSMMKEIACTMGGEKLEHEFVQWMIKTLRAKKEAKNSAVKYN